MASLGSAANVYNTCLRILQQRGYRLSAEHYEAGTLWHAAKGEYTFTADNPIELIGLTAIYDFKSPTESPIAYWWVVSGDNLYQQLFDETPEYDPSEYICDEETD
ncbi:MAG TPA: hypothetical protein VHL11_02890 [Phototrophicaceae bacterium]|jgi:hypothetical protein|nr:hypothetical protein [Phototrophicaceae bacterium]